jgi:hypothetical protein
MVIESNLHLGKGIVRGDIFPIRRNVTKVLSGLTVVGSKLTLKEALADSDPGLFQKSIVSGDSPGTGQIEADGSNGVSKLRFDITATDSLAMVLDQEYYFDIEITMSNGEKRTLEHGKTSATFEVTSS